MSDRPRPTGRERSFGVHEIIASRTDARGHVTFVNDVFVRVSGYGAREIVGRPHSVMRHPDMPRCLFRLVWGRLVARREVDAYVVSLAKSGDHYWSLARLAPTFDASGDVVGYSSSDRAPPREALPRVRALYAELCATEARQADARAGLAASMQLLSKRLAEAALAYEELVSELAA
jgi:PAS domain S-box-containing protein